MYTVYIYIYIYVYVYDQKAPNVPLPEARNFRACRLTCARDQFRETLSNTTCLTHAFFKSGK